MNFVIFAPVIFAIVELVRAFPWPDSWKQRKPLGCDTCMSWWVTLALWALFTGGRASPLPFLAGAGVTLAFYRWLRKSELVPPTE